MKLKNYSLAVAALLFFVEGACFGQSQLPQLPDTLAGNQAKGWLEVFNAGNIEKRREFCRRIIPVGWNALIGKRKCDARLVGTTW